MATIHSQPGLILSSWETAELIPFLRYAFSHTHAYDHDYVPYVLQARRALAHDQALNVNTFPNADFESVFLCAMHRHSIRDVSAEAIVDDPDTLAQFLMQKYLSEGDYELLGRSDIASKAWVEKRKVKEMEWLIQEKMKKYVEDQENEQRRESLNVGDMDAEPQEDTKEEEPSASYPDITMSMARTPYWYPRLRDQGRTVPEQAQWVPAAAVAPVPYTFFARVPYRSQTSTLGSHTPQRPGNGRWIQTYNLAGKLEYKYVMEAGAITQPQPQRSQTVPPLSQVSNLGPVELPTLCKDEEEYRNYLKLLAHHRSLERQALGLDPVRPQLNPQVSNTGHATSAPEAAAENGEQSCGL
jgi:hypothetical protein